MRGNPAVPVWCDICNNEVQMEMTALARGSYDERHLDSQLENMGWTKDGDKDICDDCTAQKAEEAEGKTEEGTEDDQLPSGKT